MDNELRRVVDALPGQCWTALPNGNVDFLNQRWLEYTGLTVQDSCGQGWQKAIHPEDLPQLLEHWESAIASGEPHEAEARMRRYDGEFRWFLFRTNPLTDASGSIVRWWGMTWDIEDRKRAEQLLAKKEQLFKAVFDEAGTGVSLVDLSSGEPIRNNRALQKMLGCSEDELSRFATFDQLTYEPSREMDADLFRGLCEGRCDSLQMEKHYIVKDGTSVWAKVIFTLLRDSECRPKYVVGIHEDITERKRALEKLQAQKELLDLAQKAARAMAFDWHIQEKINAWSPEQEALYGLAPGTFDGTYESWKKLVHPNDWPAVVASLKHAHETGAISVEFRVIWPDGSTHWLEANGQMFFDDQGKPLRMVGFTADVTSRKLVEEELRRKAAFLAQAQHVSSTGSFSWRAKPTDEITWSEELHRIFELDCSTPITPARIRSRVHPDDLCLFDNTVARARATGNNFDCEYRLLMPDQSIKYVQVVGQAIRDQDDELEFVTAAHDVTARRLSEEALDKARSDLTRVARVMTLGTLAASIAHEVNQPLSGIITNASTCVRMLDANPSNVDGARETARRIIRDGHRASDVIIRLRELFRKRETSTELFDLNEATREVIALSANAFQRYRVILRAELADELPLIRGDRVQLQQVILNLVRNALDAMSDLHDRPKQLGIKTERDENQSVRLSVEDVGVGFDTQATDNLFQPFFTTKVDGLGIGLSLSRSIIEKHHGRLWATPNDGPGATFTFSIPQAFEDLANTTNDDTYNLTSKNRPEGSSYAQSSAYIRSR